MAVVPDFEILAQLAPVDHAFGIAEGKGHRPSRAARTAARAAIARFALMFHNCLLGHFFRSFLVGEAHEAAGSLVRAARVHRFVRKCVEDGPGDIGVADLATAPRDVGDALLAAGERGADRHEGLQNIGPAHVNSIRCWRKMLCPLITSAVLLATEYSIARAPGKNLRTSSQTAFPCPVVSMAISVTR